MKKIILSLMTILTFGLANSAPVSFRNVEQKMYHSFIDLKKTNWIKTDTTKVYFNLNDNILLFENNKLKSFDVIDTTIINYPNSRVFNIKSLDDQHKKYDIEICEYFDGNMIMTIYNKEGILRYIFRKS